MYRPALLMPQLLPRRRQHPFGEVGIDAAKQKEFARDIVAEGTLHRNSLIDLPGRLRISAWRLLLVHRILPIDEHL
jgi:hypothetical protein